MPSVKPPKGLLPAGRALWRAVVADLAEDWEFDRRELTLLREAAVIADQLAALDAVVLADGVMSTGSAGQAVVHSAVAEGRQLRLAMLRILSALEIADPAAELRTSPASQRGRKAAAARWANRTDRGAA